MTNFSEAPPLGANAPTAGATTAVWSGSDNFDAALQTLIVLQFEEQLRAPLPYLLAGNFRPAKIISERGTNGTARFLAIGDLPVDVSDSSSIWVEVEGEPNATRDLDFGFEEMSVKQAMETLRLTDVSMKIAPYDLVAAAAEKLARWKMEVWNGIAAKAITGGENVFLVGGGSSAADVGPGDVLTGAAVKAAVAELEATNVPPFPDGYYRAFIHPYVKTDFMSDTADDSWVNVSKYTTAEGVLTNELGRYAGVRFIKSTTGAQLANAGSSSNDVYITPIIGPGAFAIADFGNGNQYYTPPGGHDDPAHQSALISWIGYLGAVVLGEGDNASGPVTEPRYINVYSGTSFSTS